MKTLPDFFSAPKKPIPRMLEPEFADAYDTWAKDRSPAATSGLVKAVSPVIDEAIRSYGGESTGSLALKGRAKAMAIEAAERYDPTRAKLRTHLLSHLRGLRRVSQVQSRGVYAPEGALLDAQRTHRASMELEDELGREPSDMELADRVGLSRSRIAKIRSYKPDVSEGLFRGEDEGAGGPALSAAPPTPEAVKAWHELVYHSLSGADQVVMELSLGLHGKRPLDTTGIARRLRISPSAVSQRKLKIQKMIDTYTDTGLGR